MVKFTNALGIDFGGVRVGIARVNSVARLPQPLTTLANDSTLYESLNKLIKEYEIDVLVVGQPRNMSGETTQQTQAVNEFVSELATKVTLPIIMQDETLSSVEADKFQQAGSKHTRDSLAAATILDDFVGYN